jgi:hypothetical protein
MTGVVAIPGEVPVSRAGVSIRVSTATSPPQERRQAYDAGEPRKRPAPPQGGNGREVQLLSEAQ